MFAMRWCLGILLLCSIGVDRSWGWETNGDSAGVDKPAAAEKAGESDSDSSTETEPSSDDEGDSDDLKAGHSFHGEAFNEGPRQAAYLMEGTGKVDFPVASKVPEVQAFINQGVGQLHGFWYFEAERSFRQAAALDPDCAAAYWGMAMANVNNRERAKKFIEEAGKRKDKDNERVQKYISALADYLKKKKEKAATEAYIDALEKIYYDNPDDLEALAFVAAELYMGRRNGLKMASHLAVDALIQQVLDAEPMHPVHHYRIHIWDHEKAERALASSALCGQAAPSIAHMWHMPGHIYSKVKRYPDAVWQQEASARTDHAQMMRDQLLPDQIHNFAHNNEWLIRNLIFIGRMNDALDLAKNMTELPRHPKYNMVSKGGTSSAYGRQRLMQVLDEAELWQEVVDLAESPYLQPTEILGERVKRLRLLGRAHSRLANVTQVVPIVAELEAELCQKFAARQIAIDEAEQKAKREKKNEKDTEKIVKDARRKIDSEVRSLERALNEMYGYMAAANHEHEKALELLKKSGDKDPWYQASLHLKLDQVEEAIKLVEEGAKNRKNQTLPLARKAAILWAADKRDEAMETMRELQEISAEVDLEMEPFARLAPIVAELGWDADWRAEKIASDDVGIRPDLDSLGPFRWQPTFAPDWTLPSAKGQPLALKNYSGKPVIVVFFLGYGCLHCAEQLQAFGPRAADFEEAGIDVVAISSDDQAGLQKSLENYTGEIPFTLVADPELEVFRQYRAFDDFEDQPLHGTFLIDGQGRMRWHDISYEPFMDPQFVLDEAKRLLNQEEKVEDGADDEEEEDGRSEATLANKSGA